MPHHFNAAARLLKVVSNAVDSPGPRLYDAWAHALGLGTALTTMSPYPDFALVERLVWVRMEIEAVREGMKAGNFTEALYARALQRVEAALSPINLGNAWEGTRKVLRDEALNPLAFCSEILPHDEERISDAELEPIREILSELEAFLEVGGLPVALAGMIRHHIDLIHAAMARYPVVGAVAFRQAAWTAAGEMIHAKGSDLGAQYADSQAVAKLEAMWDKTNKLADHAIRAASVYEIGSKLWEKLG